MSLRPSTTGPAQWDFAEQPPVMQIITSSARRVANTFNLDEDDLRQEALILVATKADLQECLDGDHLGLLRFRLGRDLINSATSLVTARDRLESYDLRVDPDDERPPAAISAPIRTDTSTYTRELVESLLPAIWDDFYAWGIRIENAPDADMPRCTVNKATGNTLAAHVVDIKTAWSGAPLADHHRRALFTVYGLDWTQREAAAVLEVSQQAVSESARTGVTKIANHLNGNTGFSIEMLVKDASRSDINQDGARTAA
jgi:hypothetical protein